MTMQADHTSPTVVTPRLTKGAPETQVAVPQPRRAPVDPYAPVPFDALAGHPVPRGGDQPAGLGFGAPGAPGGQPWSGPPVPPRSGPSTGRVLGIVAGVIGGIVALLVIGGIVLTLLVSSAAPPQTAPSSPAAPSSPSVAAPAQPTGLAPGVEREFNGAGKRLDQAKARFDGKYQAALDAGDREAFDAAVAEFRGEVRAYRATVTRLALPPGQQATVTTVLVPAADATIADCDALIDATDQDELVAAANRFDADWKTTADTHNTVNQSLPVG